MFLTTLLAQYPKRRYDELPETDQELVRTFCSKVFGNFLHDGTFRKLSDFLTCIHEDIDGWDVSPIIPATIAYLIYMALPDDCELVEHMVRCYYGI